MSLSFTTDNTMTDTNNKTIIEIHTKDTSNLKIPTEQTEIIAKREPDANGNCCVTHGDEWLSFFRWDGNKNAKGLALSHIASGSFTIASVFLSTALIDFAKVTAGCSVSEEDECDKRVYGIVKPSSLISIYLVILGFIASFFMPLVGALIDSTNLRRGIGRVSSMCICICLVSQTCFLSQSTWLVVALLQILLAVFGSINLCVSYAYIPELTPHEQVLSRYNASISVCFNLSVIVFLVTITTVTTIFKTSSIQTAQIAMVYCSAVSIIFYGYSWGVLFQPQPPKNVVPQVGNNDIPAETNFSKIQLLTYGLRRLWKTIVNVFSERRDLKWILISRSLTQAATIAMIASVITYVESDLDLSSSSVGIGLLIMISLAIPGNKLSVSMTRRFNPCLSLQLCFSLWIATILGIVILVYDKNRKEHVILLYIIMAIWGIAVGWKEPTEKTLFSELIPQGHEAEMMGLYIFASHIFTWLPPLLFTAINESNAVHIRANIGFLAIYFVIGIILLVFVGDYNEAVTKNKEQVCQPEEKDEKYGTFTPTDEAFET